MTLTDWLCAVSGTALITVGAWLSALALRPRSWTSLILAAYLAAWVATVTLTLGASLVRLDVARPTVLVGAAVLALSSAVVWHRRGSPRPPRLSLPRRVDPLLAALAALVVTAVVYELAVAVFTPPANPDSLWYHLVRAALWEQNGVVGYVEPTSNPFVNAFPPNAETGLLLTLVLTGTDAATQVVQLLAELALLIAVYGIARRLEFDRSASMFAALLVATLPLVALESSTPQNDLVAAAFIAAAVYFLLGHTRLDTALAGVTFGLGLGTKLTFLLAVPAIVLLVLVARRRLLVETAVALGFCVLVFGSYAFVTNVAHTGELLGNADRHGNLAADGTVAGASHTFGRMVYRLFDLSGFESVNRLRDITIAAWAAALVLTLAAVLFRRRAGGSGRATAARSIATMAVAVSVGVLVTAATAFVLEIALRAVGVQDGKAGDPAGAFEFRVNLGASEDSSAFGMLFGLVVIPLVVAAMLRARSRPRHAAIALFLPSALALLAGTIAYNDYDMRYVIGPAIVTAALLAGLYERSVLRLAAVGIAGTTVVLCLLFNHAKPTGIGEDRSAFRMTRVELQTQFTRPMRRAANELERVSRPGESVRLDLGPDDFAYPFFSANLDRTVRYRGDPARVQWIVVAPRNGGDRWRVIRAAAPDRP